MPDRPASAPAAPHPVAPLGGAPVDAAAAEFRWTPVPGAAGYRLQIAPTPDFSYEVIEVEAGPAASLTLHDTLPVGEEKDLFWRVGVAGASMWSHPQRFRPASAEVVAAHRAEAERSTPEQAQPAQATSEENLLPAYLRDDKVLSDRQTATFLVLFIVAFLLVLTLAFVFSMS